MPCRNSTILDFVGGLHAGEETGAGDSGLLLRVGQVVKLAARVRIAGGVLIFTEDGNTAAESLSGCSVIRGRYDQ